MGNISHVLHNMAKKKKRKKENLVFMECLPFIEHSRNWKRLTFSLYSGNFQFSWICRTYGAFQVMPVIKNPPASVGDLKNVGLVPGLGRSPGGGHGNPL